MKGKNVFVTRVIPDEGIKLLKEQGYSVTIREQGTVISTKQLLEQVKKYDALLCLLTDKIDEQIIEAGKDRLKIIANYAAGYDNIDVLSAKKAGIYVTNTPVEEMAESVAQHVIALIFALIHRIVQADKFTRAGKYKGWEPNLLLGTDLKEKTIGIIGLGRIGMIVAQRLQSFDVQILYHDVKRNKEFEKQYHAKYVSMETVLQSSDIVTLHVPLLEQTRHLISTPQLKLMKKTAYLINTSRGPVVDELALVKALTKKQIAGAGLDVFECEPLIDCNPHDIYELRKLDNVILTPHTASATLETRQAMSRRAAQNIIMALSGREPHDDVTKFVS